jgi:hypothetical protein
MDWDDGLVAAIASAADTERYGGIQPIRETHS